MTNVLNKTLMKSLAEANDIVNGQRQNDYGTPEERFEVYAGLWGNYLEMEITPKDVALMMILLKVARLGNKYNRDSVLDIIGYAAILADRLE